MMTVETRYPTAFTAEVVKVIGRVSYHCDRCVPWCGEHGSRTAYFMTQSEAVAFARGEIK